jgi:signal peptidase
VSEEAPDSDSDSSDTLTVSPLVREGSLALGLVVLLLGSMWISTGSFPPMVVVESGSMMHDEDGSVGAIDPGDLILVMNKNRADVVTFVEATEVGNENFGHESHGSPGDVIIFSKNGGLDTPVIHRALLEVVQNGSGWDVPGTTLRNVQAVTWTLDIDCSSFHGSYNLRIEDWEPNHSGFLTSGDNNADGCMIDQSGVSSNGPASGMRDSNNEPVEAVKDEWIVGVASSEVPWIGSIKLITSGNWEEVTPRSWYSLTLLILLILGLPVAIEQFQERNSRSEEEE